MSKDDEGHLGYPSRVVTIVIALVSIACYMHSEYLAMDEFEPYVVLIEKWSMKILLEIRFVALLNGNTKS